MRIDWYLILIDAGVDESHVDDCMKWAFGDGWENAPVSSTDERWNERHGDIFLLEPTDYVREGLMRIGKAYLKHQMKTKSITALRPKIIKGRKRGKKN